MQSQFTIGKRVVVTETGHPYFHCKGVIQGLRHERVTLTDEDRQNPSVLCQMMTSGTTVTILLDDGTIASVSGRFVQYDNDL